MQTFFFLTTALLAVVAVAAPGSPSPTTTAFEASRPSGAPGFFYSFTTQIPGSGQNGKLGGGAAFTATNDFGEAAGTVQGLGPTGPNAANGHLAGGFGGASGVLKGSAAPTKVQGCAGGAAGGQGYTQCLTLRDVAATAAPAML